MDLKMCSTSYISVAIIDYTDREMEASENSEGRGRSAPLQPNFEVIDGLLYRKKLERGFINYREVLDEDRRQEAIGTFHRRRPDQRHLSLEDTYKSVADNYWWDGKRHQIPSTDAFIFI
uniref:Uncharacterized protein n=1 Tax=Periophthalmus magnuspinnatus TaxID=409849 RepID=A0A3B4A5M2_9GOBI